MCEALPRERQRRRAPPPAEASVIAATSELSDGPPPVGPPYAHAATAGSLLPVAPCRERGRGGAVGRASPSTLPSPLSLSLPATTTGGGWSAPPDPAPQPHLASASPPWLRDDNGAASRGTTTAPLSSPDPGSCERNS